MAADAKTVAIILKNVIHHGTNWKSGQLDVWGVMQCADFEVEFDNHDGNGPQKFTVRIMPEGVK
jgi:hypothetical protein